jgi:hypothetical protein
VLLNRVGRTALNEDGYPDPGLNVTLSDAATTDIHAYGGNDGLVLTGLWQPDGRYLDPSSSGAAFDAAARDHGLGVFTGGNPNGDWTLFLADRSSGDIATILSWSVQISAVPEASSLLCAGVLAVLTTGGVWLQRRRRHPPGSPQEPDS